MDARRSRVVFEKLERDLLKLGSKPRAENVHGFRTGTRRIQILLGELSPKLGRNDKKLLKLLERIRKRAGKVRDLDVQLGALRELKAPREPRRKTELANRLIGRRGDQEKKLRHDVDDHTVREIRKRLKRASKSFRSQASRDPLEVAREMLKPMDTHEEMSEAMLHRYRILTKRARYAAEFAGRSAEATKFISGLKRIQDALGDWHDWLTLRQSAVAVVGEVQQSPLLTELQNVTGAKFRHAVAVLAQVRGTQMAAKPRPASAMNPSKARRDAAA